MTTSSTTTRHEHPRHPSSSNRTTEYAQDLLHDLVARVHEETRAWLLENATPAVIQEMRDAIARAIRGESRSTAGAEQQSSDDEDYETGTTGVDDTDGQAFLLRYITVPLARTFHTRLMRMSMLY